MVPGKDKHFAQYPTGGEVEWWQISMGYAMDKELPTFVTLTGLFFRMNLLKFNKNGIVLEGFHIFTK